MIYTLTTADNGDIRTTVHSYNEQIMAELYDRFVEDGTPLFADIDAAVAYVRDLGVQVQVQAHEAPNRLRFILAPRTNGYIPPTLNLAYSGAGDVEVTGFFSDSDGLPVVQIDAESGARFRINLNDGLLASVARGGDDVKYPVTQSVTQDQN